MCHVFDKINYSEIVFFISNWSVWLSSENLHLFYGYRKYLVYGRKLIEAFVYGLPVWLLCRRIRSSELPVKTQLRAVVDDSI